MIPRRNAMRMGGLTALAAAPSAAETGGHE